MSQTIELDLTYEPYKNEVVRYTKYLGKEQIISPAEDVNEYKKRTTLHLVSSYNHTMHYIKYIVIINT